MPQKTVEGRRTPSVFEACTSMFRLPEAREVALRPLRLFFVPPSAIGASEIRPARKGWYASKKTERRRRVISVPDDSAGRVPLHRLIAASTRVSQAPATPARRSTFAVIKASERAKTGKLSPLRHHWRAKIATIAKVLDRSDWSHIYLTIEGFSFVSINF